MCLGGEELLVRQCRTSPGPAEGSGENAIACTVNRGTQTASDEFTRANAGSANAVADFAAHRKPRRGSTAGADLLCAGARPGLDGAPHGRAVEISSRLSVFGRKKSYCRGCPRGEKRQSARESVGSELAGSAWIAGKEFDDALTGPDEKAGC